MAEAARKLTVKQDAFVKAYISNGGNATQAAISAGYPKKCAASVGAENLRKPHIQKAIRKHRAKLQKKYEITVDGQVEKYEEVRKLSIEAKQYGPANTAIKGQSDLFGIEAPKKISITGDLSGIFQVVSDDA